MLTPLDIQNKEFKREMRGYATAEVDDFFDVIIESYEKLYKENIEARDKIDTLTKALGEYKEMKETLQNALITAQTAGDEVITNARAKGQRILDEAQTKAENIVLNAENNITALRRQYEKLKQSVERYQERVTALMDEQKRIMERLPEEDDALMELLAAGEPEETPEENKETE